MSIVDIRQFSSVLDEQDVNLFRDKELSYDAKMICHWLYYICKVLLVLRGLG